MARCAITTIKSLKQIINDFPDDYFISTNQVGNLSIYRAVGKQAEMLGYIELLNLDFFDGTNCPDAVYTALSK